MTVHQVSRIGSRYDIQFSVDKRHPLLFLAFIEEALHDTSLYRVDGISECYIRQNGRECWVDIVGNNFDAVKRLERALVDVDSLYSNNIYQVMLTYGIEAARNAIIDEISSVFSIYSVSLDERHLALIADYMTQLGALRPCSRYGIQYQTQPLLKASFERASHFITQSACYREVDNQNTPSSNITMGQLPRVGTGCFDLLQVVEAEE